MNRPLRIAITTGDVDGIGSEITAKALAKLKPKKGIQFILWRSSQMNQKHLKLIDSGFDRITVKNWHRALETTPNSYKEIIDIESNLAPPVWVETTAEAGLFRHIDGIVTAPLSKTTIKASRMSDKGHTDILRRVASRDELFMAFLGKKFNVLLASDHIPLEEVPQTLNAKHLEKAVLAANTVRKYLNKTKANKPIGLVGLNPHAGEEGLIGLQEKRTFNKVLQAAKKKRISISDPLVPDVAFFEENWKKYSIYLCPYHDQGLIPFKMIHGRDSGVHITMGLPFIRTSVDHGTAKNIFGKNIADPNSMFEALNWCIHLCRNFSRTGTKYQG